MAGLLDRVGQVLREAFDGLGGGGRPRAGLDSAADGEEQEPGQPARHYDFAEARLRFKTAKLTYRDADPAADRTIVAVSVAGTFGDRHWLRELDLKPVRFPGPGEGRWQLLVDLPLRRIEFRFRVSYSGGPECVWRTSAAHATDPLQPRNNVLDVFGDMSIPRLPLYDAFHEAPRRSAGGPAAAPYPPGGFHLLACLFAALALHRADRPELGPFDGAQILGRALEEAEAAAAAAGGQGALRGTEADLVRDVPPLAALLPSEPRPLLLSSAAAGAILATRRWGPLRLFTATRGRRCALVARGGPVPPGGALLLDPRQRADEIAPDGAREAPRGPAALLFGGAAALRAYLWRELLGKGDRSPADERSSGAYGDGDGDGDGSLVYLCEIGARAGARSGAPPAPAGPNATPFEEAAVRDERLRAAEAAAQAARLGQELAARQQQRDEAQGAAGRALAELEATRAELERARGALERARAEAAAAAARAEAAEAEAAREAQGRREAERQCERLWNELAALRKGAGGGAYNGTGNGNGAAAAAAADAELARRRALEEDAALGRAVEAEAVRRCLAREAAALDAAAAGGAQELLQHVYAAHPPRAAGQAAPAPGQLEPRMGPEAVRRALLSALQQYHPDKNGAEGYGRRWHELCGQISARLTAKLEVYRR